MAMCARCSSEFGFFDGFVTAKGMVCKTCNEILKLEKSLGDLLKPMPVEALYEKLEKDSAAWTSAARLVELDPKRKDLRLAACSVDLKKNRAPTLPCSADVELATAAYVFLFRRGPDTLYFDRLVEMQKFENAAKLLETNDLEANETWIERVEKLRPGIEAARLLKISFKLQGPVTRPLIQLIASVAEPASVDGIKAWIPKARFLSSDDLAFLLTSIRDRMNDAAAFNKVLTGACERAAGKGEELILLDAVDATEMLQARIRGKQTLDSDLLSALEKIARRGNCREEILAYTLRYAAAGPLADRLCALAEAAVGEGIPDQRVLDVMTRCENWALATDYQGRCGLRGSGSSLRETCRSTLAMNETECRKRLARAVRAVCEAKIAEAHSILAKVAEFGTRAPVSSLSALALDSLLLCAELEASLATHRKLIALAEARKGRQPALKEEGAATRLAVSTRDLLAARVAELVRRDEAPHFVLLLPGGFGEEELARARAEDGRREQRFDSAVKERDVSEPTLLFPTLLSAFATAVATAAARRIDGAPGGPVERSSLYGGLAMRLMAPIDPKADVPERTGPRDLATECVLRAIAFMPSVSATSTNRWGEFIRVMSGALSHYGLESSRVFRIDEYRPMWLTDAAELALELKSLKEEDHLPPLDGMRAFGRDQLYRSDAAPAPAAGGPRSWSESPVM